MIKATKTAFPTKQARHLGIKSSNCSIMLKKKKKKLNVKGGLVSTPHSDWMADLADTDASRQASL